MIIICGKTATGKTTVMKELCNKYGFTPIVSYTTRPQRRDEVDGKDYHFVNKFTFWKMIITGQFAEWFSYNTVYGKWYYGSTKSSYVENGVKILTPAGIKKIINKIKDKNPKVFLLEADYETILKRAIIRGDSVKELLRRIETDNEDFKDFKADYVIQTKSVNQVVTDIIKLNSEK